MTDNALTEQPDTMKASPAVQIAVIEAKTDDRSMADAVVGGLAINAMTLANFSRPTFGELSLEDCALALKESTSAVNRGELAQAETILMAQGMALNAIFGDMSRRAALNMGEHLPAAEVFMRLALKAQAQCRSTLETLAAIKNPIIFAKQANFAHNQQVNNGGEAHSTEPRTRKKNIQPNELLEDMTLERTQLDTGTATATGRKDSRVEPMGAVNRPAQSRR